MRKLIETPENGHRWMQRLRRAAALVLAARINLTCPKVAFAGEDKETHKDISVESEMGVVVGIPPTQTCDPYNYNSKGSTGGYGKVKLSRNVVYDAHGHAIGQATEDEKCTSKHPPVTLGFSYLFAPPFHSEEEEDGGVIQEVVQIEEDHEGLAGHPPHRFKLQLGIPIGPQQKFEFLPKVELALVPKDRPQFGFGIPVSLHIGKYHEVTAAWIVRFSRGKLQNWEAQFLYTTRLFGPVSGTAVCMTEGHDGEVNVGCGAGVGLNFKKWSLTFDGAWGKAFQHYHFALTVGFGGAGGHKH